ncbi:MULTISPECIES: aminoacyl-tRNA hydrolase [unclassified Corynebacterium]|uniref:aminoacyl-tRNA hydrolase n=1 Tax=unclassified Corynebacterium TaxID=2624378 RepID=UPI0037C012AD
MMTFLIFGLGNPGPSYAKTRHNIGRMALDELLERTGETLKQHTRTRTQVAETHIASHRVILSQGRSYMNESGIPVRALADFYKIDPSRMLILFDDLELEFGHTALRHHGGDHGHKGLRSITRSAGKDYIRCALGIGRPPGRMDVSSFVLKPFSKKEQESLPVICADMADEIERYIATTS